jgi:hypothetical protein
MAATTNRVPYEDVADLLSTARACVTWVVDGRPHVEPAEVVDEHGRFLVGVDGPGPGDDVDEVVLVVDEGTLFFDLRAMHVRGKRVWAATPAADGRAWFEIEPAKVTCWDYGRLRIDDGRR